MNMVIELTKEELVSINAGNTGSRRGAFLAGRMLGLLIGFPYAPIYYTGTDNGWW